jgi:phosphohistidine phosphatase
MLTLSLLRHAKSSWDDPALDDFDRPLGERGVKAAPLMGRYLMAEDLRPDLVICSGAVRTRATLALIMPELGAPPPDISYEDDLYLASASRLLGRVHKADRARNILLIGHNPGLHALALALVGDGKRRDLDALATKFPTAALAVFTFDVDKWSAVKAGTGALVRFVTPRQLA